MKQRKETLTKVLSLLLVVLLLGLTPMSALAESNVVAGQNETRRFANGLPVTIPAGETLKLEKDYVMEAGQWFESIDGTLDGQGHTITLKDKPLANVVAGTIQNLGVTSEAVIEAGPFYGSFASELKGTIQNCYSTVQMHDSNFFEPAGFVGKIQNGSKAVIQNSYFAGKITSAFSFTEGQYGGLIGNNNPTDTVVRNAYFGDGTTVGVALYGSDRIQKENVSTKPLSDFQTGKVTDLLNVNLPDTGFVWANPLDGNNQGMPILVRTGAVTPNPQPQKPNKDSLKALVAECATLKEVDYTPDSWTVFAQALAEAQRVIEHADATTEALQTAKTNLEIAKTGLKRTKPTKPIAPPTDTSKIIHISSEAELDRYANGAGYYVLDQNITLTDWMAPLGEFQGVLDGNGHSIEITGNRTWMFEHIGETGVLQNIHFTGTRDAQYVAGPVGKNLKGTIINCHSDMKGKNACGFARRLDGGSIVNCYSVDGNQAGPLVNEYISGTIEKSYWLDTLENPAVIPQEAMIQSGAKSETEMKTKEFVALLNANRGEHGTSWGQSSTGYPYFGADQDYKPGPTDKPAFPANKYQVLFGPENGEKTAVAQQMILTDPSEALADGTIGVFQLQNVPETSRIEWSVTDVKPANAMMIGMEDGILAYKKDAIASSATVIATEITNDGNIDDVAWIQVVSKAKKLTELQLKIDDTDVTNKNFTVEGSKEKKITVLGKYEGVEGYVVANPTQFTYQVQDETMIHSYGSSAFSFKKPGTSCITVQSKKDSTIQANVTITSTYVPVTSVKPGISGTKTLHGVDANDYIHYAFNPEYATVVVEPGHASYAGNFTVESSNPDVAKYTGTGGYIASKAGAVTYTAKIKQTDPVTGKVSEVSGTTEVNYVYQNPLTSVSIATNAIQISLEMRKQLLDLQFEGALSKDGWNISYPNMKWEYSKPGIVTIGKKEPGYWKKRPADEGKPDHGLFVSGDQYEVVALNPGTVTVTGTPEDTTHHVEPITFEVTVTGDAKPQLEIDALVKNGLQAAEQDFATRYSEYKYSNEFVVYALLRAGKTISPDILERYYQSVERTVQNWKPDRKATDYERVALAMLAMKRDLSNVGGKDLAAMIYNHEGLAGGSNDLAWALLALDATHTEIPADAKWNRDRIIAKLLEFQNANGGFGLFDNQGAGIDTTAMVLQALAPSRLAKPEVAAAIERGLAYLKTQLPETCDYGTAESNAQVILALTTLGIDPIHSEFGTKTNNLIHALMKYCTDNGFVHTVDGTLDKYNVMPSVQAHQALMSYLLFATAQNTYWDLSGGVKPEDPVQVGKVSLKILDGPFEDKGMKPIPAKGVILDKQIPIFTNDTILTIVERACKEHGIAISIREEGYIEMIANLSEFDRGVMSGWMGTLDGVFPNTGLGNYSVADGEVRDGSVITMEYTNERNDLMENADLKTPGLSGGTLKEEFVRNHATYTVETSKDSISFAPEAYNRYSLVTIEANGKGYAPGQHIPVEHNMIVKLTSQKSMRGEECKVYTFQVQKKESIVPGWKQNSTGWWYLRANGTYPASEWDYINGSWYYFDENGYMYEQGWHWIGGKCYYMYASGAMASNTWIDGYYVDASGAWIEGKVPQGTWKKDSNGWWYLYETGRYPVNEWDHINGSWYYFDKNGYMYEQGWHWISGKCYYMYASGAMASNTWIDGYYVDASGAWVQ